MNKIIDKKKILTYILITSIIYFLYKIFYKFIINFDSSDFGIHIQSAFSNKGYSLMHILFKFVGNIYYSNKLFALLMCFIIILTILFVCLFIIKYTQKKRNLYLIISLVSLFLSSIYIPKYYNHLYDSSTLITQPWHNSTYILMRLFGIGTIIIYFDLINIYNEKTSLKKYILFTILLFLTNFSKPNFFLAFAPTMLITLIYDFVKTKRKTFKSALKFGSCVLISMPILFYQTSKVYLPTENSKIILSSKKLFDLFLDKKLIISLICNLMFPIIILIIILNLLKKDKIQKKELRKYVQAWIMFIISYLEYMFITETGPRSLHGNYTWGIYFFTLILYITSLCELINIKKNNIINKKLFIILIIIYIIQILFGLYYCYLLLTGNSYII